ncbi:MAG: hypothetical protein U9R25_16080 [Chloroflexota bacterium]|nr:hypothetical protein [Chloroflexota bacterium]
MSIQRRGFLKLSATAMAGALIAQHPDTGLAAPSTRSPSGDQFSGINLAGWDIVVGDAIYAAPRVDPVTIDDIETVHFPEFSELRANIHLRRIMAHNITFKKRIADNVFDFVHTFGYKFRLPYMPSTSNPTLNPQTIEGGMGLWDGSDTRLDYGTGFQWYINPWGPDAGAIQSWTDIDGGSWAKVGNMPLDTAWHQVRITLDVRRETTALVIDGTHYLCRFNGTPKPATWGTERAATIAAEIVSLYPGESHPGALHKAEFKDWFWIWKPYNQRTIFLPTVSR